MWVHRSCSSLKVESSLSHYACTLLHPAPCTPRTFFLLAAAELPIPLHYLLVAIHVFFPSFPLSILHPPSTSPSSPSHHLLAVVGLPPPRPSWDHVYPRLGTSSSNRHSSVCIDLYRWATTHHLTGSILSLCSTKVTQSSRFCREAHRTPLAHSVVDPPLSTFHYVHPRTSNAALDFNNLCVVLKELGN